MPKWSGAYPSRYRDPVCVNSIFASAAGGVAAVGSGSAFGSAVGTGAIIVACGGALASISSSAFGSSVLGSSTAAAARLGGPSAVAGISSTSHEPHQRHLIAASWISSAQYGQVFMAAAPSEPRRSRAESVPPERDRRKPSSVGREHAPALHDERDVGQPVDV